MCTSTKTVQSSPACTARLAHLIHPIKRHSALGLRGQKRCALVNRKTSKHLCGGAKGNAGHSVASMLVRELPGQCVSAAHVRVLML
jgi:hypothetical protein